MNDICYANAQRLSPFFNFSQDLEWHKSIIGYFSQSESDGKKQMALNVAIPQLLEWHGSRNSFAIKNDEDSRMRL